MKVLTLVQPGQGRPQRDELRVLEQSDRYPRSTLFADLLNTDLLDEEFLARIPAWRRILYWPLPTLLSQLIEAFLIRGRYDAVISWAETLGLPFALLLKLMRARTPHVALFSWISKPKKAKFLSFVHSHIDRIMLWSSYQRDFAIQQIRIPESKIEFSRWYVDQKFWRPLNKPSVMICAAGREMRDYQTLLQAVEGLDIPCHIAVSYMKGRKDPWMDMIRSVNGLPSHITVGQKSFTELRDLYASSRFVVVPLLPQSDTDNGVTVILEAMAMGKPVICSKTMAQIDVIQPGKTGMLVPPGDPKALREAILHLWEHPEEAERMGKRGREYIEEFHTFDGFCHQVKRMVEEVVAEKRNH